MLKSLRKRRLQRPHPRVLLITTIVRFIYHLLHRTIPVIGDIEKAFRFFKQIQLPLALQEFFPNDHDSVSTLALRRGILEFRNILTNQFDVLIAALFDDFLLDIFRASTWNRFDFVPRLALEFFPLLFGDFFGDSHDILPIRHAKDEWDARLIPTI